MTKATQPAALAAPVWTVIKSAKAPKMSSRANGLLHYEVGKNDEGRYALRITANDTGGLFSKHWLSLDDILALLDLLKDAPFKSVALKALFVRGSANNHGFLAAVLRAEKLLLAAEPNSPFHRIGLSLSDWLTQLGEPASMDKPTRKGKAKGQKGQETRTVPQVTNHAMSPRFWKQPMTRPVCQTRWMRPGPILKPKPVTLRPVRRLTNESP